jgi:outer membrane protein
VVGNSAWAALFDRIERFGPMYRAPRSSKFLANRIVLIQKDTAMNEKRIQVKNALGGAMPFRKTMITMITMAALLLTIAIPVAFSADVAKIGTVNFQRIFENSTAGKAARDKINTEGQRMEQELKQNGEEIKALEKRLEQDTGVMSRQAREEQKWELERKIEDIKALRKKYDRRIQDMQIQLVNEVRQSVLQIIQDFGKKEGFLLVIEDISVVYSPQQLDITDQIVKIYNDQYARQGKQNQGPKG